MIKINLRYLRRLVIWIYYEKKEKLQMKIAWRMPHWLVMWCVVRVGAHATQGQYSNQVVPDLTLMDALKRWDTAA
jgi:hypothetical protein